MASSRLFDVGLREYTAFSLPLYSTIHSHNDAAGITLLDSDTSGLELCQLRPNNAASSRIELPTPSSW